MKLLICTQAVDLDDPVLGFFHRWIAEFAKRCDTVHVICLKSGRVSLPPHVFVHSLGKENGRSRVRYVLNFYRYLWNYRREYDVVFVHMNPEYICLGGFLWRALGKRIVLWYVHKKISLRLRVGVFFSNAICSASRGSFRLNSRKLHVVGHGIDTAFFSPGGEAPKRSSILFLGRLDPVKRVEIFVQALETLHDTGAAFAADIVGDPTEKPSRYAHDVRNMAGPLALDGFVAMHPGVTNDAARDLFRSHAIYCNLTPSGSFDKTILEAMACGSIVVASNAALADILDERLLVKSDAADAPAAALRAALNLSEAERHTIAGRSRSYVVREHSLSTLVERIITVLEGSGAR